MAWLERTFYSDGVSLPFKRGWWAVVDGRAYFLWEDEDGPEFEDLARVIQELAPVCSIEEAIDIARADDQLVRRKPWVWF